MQEVNKHWVKLNWTKYPRLLWTPALGKPKCQTKPSSPLANRDVRLELNTQYMESQDSEDRRGTTELFSRISGVADWKTSTDTEDTPT